MENLPLCDTCGHDCHGDYECQNCVTNICAECKCVSCEEYRNDDAD